MASIHNWDPGLRLMSSVDLFGEFLQAKAKLLTYEAISEFAVLTEEEESLWQYYLDEYEFWLHHWTLKSLIATIPRMTVSQARDRYSRNKRKETSK